MFIAAVPRQGVLSIPTVLPSSPCAMISTTSSGSISWPAAPARSIPASPDILTAGFLSTRPISIEGFTKKYQVHRLVYYETYDHVQRAFRREKQLKGWRREKKIALIEKSNPRWQNLAENWGREMRFREQPLERTP